jgi:hypothetical protein
MYEIRSRKRGGHRYDRESFELASQVNSTITSRARTMVEWANVIVPSDDAQALPILTNHPHGLALLMGREFGFGTELNDSFAR